MSDFTVYEKMRCLEREVRLRNGFRKRALEFSAIKRSGGTLKNPDWYEPNFNKLEYQIRCMQEIADEYRAKWDGVVPELNVEDGFMA